MEVISWQHRWVVSCTPPTGDLAHNPGICPDWEWNQRPFGSQAGTQSTEPHQPGQKLFLTVLESPTWSCFGDSCLPGSWSEPSCCVLTWQKGQGIFLGTLLKVRAPSPHDLVTLQRPYLLILSPWAVGFQHMNFGGYKHSIYTAGPHA